MVRGSWLVAAVLAGCGGGDDAGQALSSSTLARTAEGALLAVNVDEGSLSRFDPKGRKVDTVALGGEPTRVAVAGSRAFVTLRAEGAVAILDAETLEVERKVAVGAEPYGIVATADGSRFYVAVSLADSVVEHDGHTGEVLRTFAVEHEPRWLALSPNEQVLFVASARSGGELSRIDLETGRISTFEAPETGGEKFPEDAGEPASDRIPGLFTPRTTGDLVVSPDGDTLAVPTLFVDNTTPVTTVDDPSGGGGYGGDAGVEASRVNPALVLYPLSPKGEPGEGRAVFLGVRPARQAFGREVFRSFPNAVTTDPTGRYFAVSMEASDGVVIVDSEPYAGQPADDRRRSHRTFGEGSGIPASLLGFWDRPVSFVKTGGAAPRGLSLVEDRLYVHTVLDRRIESVAWKDVVAANEHEAEDRGGRVDPTFLEAREEARELVKSVLPEDVALGRRMFFSATDRKMASKNSGISCSTCHFDGRDDSVTWTFAEGEGEVHLQTPSLAGPVNETAPLTWRSPVMTVADEARLTTTLRMGGTGPSADELAAIEAFVVRSRLPLVPAQDPDAVARGQLLFEREDVGCAECHVGPRLTDGRAHVVLGRIEANTPQLNGVAASGPWLHDGSARTLGEVLDYARSGLMGDTSMLSDAELSDLEAYLRSL